jgi:uncharacterized membrane protein
MKHVIPSAFMVELVIETKHNQMLEAVLDSNFERRTAEEAAPCINHLRSMLNQAFVTEVEIQVYGYVTLIVEAVTYEQLEKEIVRCNTVVGRWLTRFKIEEMKL